MSAFFERVRAALATKGYEVLHELGTGGMGIVVLARQVKLERFVAVKVIRPEMHTALAVERFLEEGRILAGFSHPHIVPVYEADEAQGLPYYSMQYLAGETVASRLQMGPIPRSEVRKLGRDLLDALQAAHALGIVHRDVKPSNVFWDGKSAVLVDFGIAKRVLPTDDSPARRESLTAPGFQPGTRSYMSPEQLAGADATPASDLYAAALVIYEAYTARHWLDAQHLGWRAWVGVPLFEGWVIRRALAWDGSERWPDAPTFRHRLWQMLHWRYRLRAVGLTAAGLVVGAAVVQYILTRPPSHPSGLQVVVRRFEDVCTTTGRAGERVARALAMDLEGYIDFSVQGPDRTPFFVKQSAVIVAGSICAHGDTLDADVNVGRKAQDADPPITAHADTGRPDQLAADLAYRIMLEIWKRDNPLDPVLPQQALPRTGAGLAAWLFAERLFAQARWGQADSAYARAEAIDTTCWLCYWRHREVQQWLGQDPDPDLAQHYLSHLESFPLRYQQLMLAVNLPLRARLEALRSITDQWREFFPAWFQLADESYHRGPLLGRARAEAVEAFQMTVRLRPAFGPALEHLTWALTAEGDSAGAAAAWSQLEALGDPSDPFTVAIRALLQVGFASRFLDSAAARRVMDALLGSPGIQQFPELAAGPRYLPTFDAPNGAVAMGDLFAESSDRVLERSGLIAGAFGRVALGQLAGARSRLANLRDRFNEPELRLTLPELNGTLTLLGFDPSNGGSGWGGAVQLLMREAESAVATPAARRRAAWLLVLGARRFGGADTTRYKGLLAQEPAPRALARLVASDSLAHRGRYEAALALSDTLRQLEAPALSGASPFLRAVLHTIRAEWYIGAGRPDDAERELVWYENNDVSGLPTRNPQVGDIDWAFGTFARWRRASLLEQADRPEEACRAYRAVARLWATGEPAYRARADSAARRLVMLRCTETP
jgi:Protein kinase domain